MERVSLDIYKRRQTRYKTVTMAPDGGTRHHCNQHQISAGTGELSADAWTSVTKVLHLCLSSNGQLIWPQANTISFCIAPCDLAAEENGCRNRMDATTVVEQ